MYTIISYGMTHMSEAIGAAGMVVLGDITWPNVIWHYSVPNLTKQCSVTVPCWALRGYSPQGLYES